MHKKLWEINSPLNGDRHFSDPATGLKCVEGKLFPPLLKLSALFPKSLQNKCFSDLCIQLLSYKCSNLESQPLKGQKQCWLGSSEPSRVEQGKV